MKTRRPIQPAQRELAGADPGDFRLVSEVWRDYSAEQKARQQAAEDRARRDAAQLDMFATVGAQA